MPKMSRIMATGRPMTHVGRTLLGCMHHIARYLVACIMPYLVTCIGYLVTCIMPRSLVTCLPRPLPLTVYTYHITYHVFPHAYAMRMRTQTRTRMRQIVYAHAHGHTRAHAHLMHDAALSSDKGDKPARQGGQTSR
jgi:hypothetical protein